MSETKVPGLNVRITSKSQLDNIKKVAITKPGQQALFLELDQVVPITDTVFTLIQFYFIHKPATPHTHVITKLSLVLSYHL